MPNRLTPVSIEKTLILVKPDGVRRALVGEVISRIEAKGYQITALKMLQADRALLEQHYAEHQNTLMEDRRNFELSQNNDEDEEVIYRE